MPFASKDTRQRAIAAYKTGLYTQAQVAAMFGVHYKTIFNWLKADTEGREQIPRPKGHLRRILDSADLAMIDRIKRANPAITLAGLMERVGKPCSLDVYARALRELGYENKRKAKERGAKADRTRRVSASAGELST